MPQQTAALTLRASGCLPTGYTAATPVIDRYHEVVCSRTRPSPDPMGWTFAQHLGRCWPQLVMDHSWEEIQTLAGLLGWGERAPDGQLTPEAIHLLDRAWGAYCLWLRFAAGRRRMMGLSLAPEWHSPGSEAGDAHPGIADGWGGDGARAGESVLGPDGHKQCGRVLTGTKWENGEGRIDPTTGQPYASGDYYGVWDVDDYLEGIKHEGAFDAEDPIYKLFWLDDQGRIRPVKRLDALTRNPDLFPWPHPDHRGWPGWLRVRIVSRRTANYGHEVSPLTEPILDLDYTEDPSREQDDLTWYIGDQLESHSRRTKVLWRCDGYEAWLHTLAPVSDPAPARRLWAWPDLPWLRIFAAGRTVDGALLYDRTPAEVTQAAAEGGTGDPLPDFAVSFGIPAAVLTPDRIPKPEWIVIGKDRLRGQAFTFDADELDRLQPTAEVFTRSRWVPDDEQAAAVPLPLFTDQHAVIHLSSPTPDTKHVPEEAGCVCGERWTRRSTARRALLSFRWFQAEHEPRHRAWGRIIQSVFRHRRRRSPTAQAVRDFGLIWERGWPVLKSVHLRLEADKDLADSIAQRLTGPIRSGWKLALAAADELRWGERKDDGTLTLDAEDDLRTAYMHYVSQLSSSGGRRRLSDEFGARESVGNAERPSPSQQ